MKLSFEIQLPDGYDERTSMATYHHVLIIAHPDKPPLLYYPDTKEAIEIQVGSPLWDEAYDMVNDK